MPLDQARYLVFTFGFPVAEIYPNRYRKAKLRRHYLGIVVFQLSSLNQKDHKAGEIAHNIGVILLCLKRFKGGVLKLFYGQHSAGFADLRIVQNIIYMA